ncbi:D-alanyl-D-alanine carboxypeptidase DacC precursor [compost metagenome]
MRAKTGSLANVSALSGYVTAANGEELVFSIMTNNFPGPGPGGLTPKQMEDRVAEALAEFAR